MRWMALCVSLGLASIGCERSTEADNGSKRTKVDEVQESKASDDAVTSLPQIDTSTLDEFAQRIWIDMVNELLSPCGDPMSVGRCVASSHKCGKCVPAARYVARLVDDGFSRDEIRNIYRERYGDDTKVVGITAKDSPLVGSPMAPVTIYEFSDFQCPHCKTAAPYLKKVVEESNGKVKLVFKQYPLKGHPRARDAARAAVAAQKQGKFWEMHDLLFEKQDELQRANFEGYAKKLGLDVEKFKADMVAPETEKKVEADLAEGRAAGVDSTPSIFVNDRRYIFPPDKLAEYVREELDQ